MIPEQKISATGGIRFRTLRSHSYVHMLHFDKDIFFSGGFRGRRAFIPRLLGLTLRSYRRVPYVFDVFDISKIEGKYPITLTYNSRVMEDSRPRKTTQRNIFVLAPALHRPPSKVPRDLRPVRSMTRNIPMRVYRICPQR